MSREEYLKLSLGYFQGHLSVEELLCGLEQSVPFEVDELSLPNDERVMLIVNHPKADEALSLPAEQIAGLKGGNTKNFPSHWFPAVRQMMLQKVLQRRFFTLAFNIGWSVSMQELGHLLIKSNGNGRCQEIISLMKNDQSSLVIFPEGGARDLQIFRTGFFYIACELGIRHLIVCAFYPTTLSLERQNGLRIIHIEDMSRFIDPVIQFADVQRERIREAVRKE